MEKVDLQIENEGGGFNLPMIQNSKYSPMESPILLAKNTHLLQTRAGSLDINDSDLEQNTNTKC